MKQLQILMVGCGKMGGALLINWMLAGDNFTVVDPSLAEAPTGVELGRDISDLRNITYDVIVIAIKPQLIDAVLPAYEAMLAPNGYLLSIAAGCSIKRIKNVSGDKPVIRVMPNLPTAIGKGVSAICASDDAIDTHMTHATQLMERTGTVISVDDEDALDRFTGVAGSGPGYVFEFARTYVEATKAMGFDDAAARKMVLAVIEGSAAMAQSEDDDLATLRDLVTSKGGTTEAGLDAMNGNGQLDEIMSATVSTAYERALELR